MSFSVVILSKNASNLLPCLEHIRQCHETCRIFVVDDGLDLDRIAKTGSCLLCDADPLQVLEGEKPFIFARNANIGIRAAGEHDVILLNDDALLRTPHGFSKLSMCAAANPKFGVIASSCNNVGNTNQFPQTGGLREDPRMVCFVCVYIPRSTINAVGLLDERFTGYGCEDDDYCLRVRQVGLKIGIYDGCFVDHLTLKSEFRGHGAGDYRPNLQIFKDKHGIDNWGNPSR